MASALSFSFVIVFPPVSCIGTSSVLKVPKVTPSLRGMALLPLFPRELVRVPAKERSNKSVAITSPRRIDNILFDILYYLLEWQSVLLSVAPKMTELPVFRHNL